MTSIPLKRCTKCGEEFPATTEFFHFLKGKPRSHCKRCRCEDQREYCAAHPEETAIRKWEWENKNREKVNSRLRKYAADNPEKVRESKRKSAKKQASQIAESRNRPEAKKKKREYDRRRYSANSEAVIRRVRQWDLNNPAKVALQSQAVRTRKHGLPFSFTDEDWQRCLEYWGHKCCICGNPPDLWHVLAREHWIAVTDPRSDNPGTVPWNILPMCHSRKGSRGMAGCNNSKHNKDPEQWLIETFGKRKARQILKRIQAYFEWVRNQ